MAHTPGTTARLQRLSALAAIVLVAVAVGFAFGRILVGHGATYRMLAVGLTSGLIAWLTERRGMLVATVASAAALVVTLGWLAAPQTTWFGLPGAETLRTLGTLATQVGAQAREYVSPAPATPALIMAGSIAVWAAVFSCYALAFRAQSPLLSLVPPIALVVFADSVLDEFVRPFYGVLFLLAALTVLFADSLRRIRGWGPVWSPAGARDRLIPVAGRNARRVGLSAVALAALAPVFMPGFGTTAVVDISRFGSDNRIRVSPLVSMGSLLSQAAAQDDNPELFRVTADQPSYWRMVVLDTFDGNTWEARPDEGVQLTGPSIQEAPTSGTPVTQTYEIGQDLGFGWLFGAADPTSISIEHDVWWHPASSSLQMNGWPDGGETYEVTSVRPDVLPDVLRTAGVSGEAAADTTLPADIPPSIEATAREWVGDSETQYDQVMAILSHLRDGDFEYTLDVNYGDDSEALEQFLKEKRGFCQQFASLTAVMLRYLGIPARVALGFTTGQPAGTNTWAVTLKQYHAWVEVPFQGYGWLSFDPTPRFSDPSAVWQPNTSLNSPPCVGGPQCGLGGEKGGGKDKNGGLHGDGSVKGGTLNLPGAVPDAPPGSTDTGPRVTLATLVAGAGAVIGIIGIAIPVVRRLRRRRRMRAAHDPRTVILARYDVFSDRAKELGWGKTPGETPEEYRRRLAANEQLGDEAREPLSRLTLTVVRAAYAPDDPDGIAVEAVDRDTATVLHRLRETTPLKQRVIGLYRRD
jgi:transglutaminase-like putative cysteine protease